MAKVAYFDCFAGLTGTMALAALLDAGLDHLALGAEIQKLYPGGWELRAERAVHNVMAGTEVRLTVDAADATCDLGALQSQFGQSGLDTAVQQRSLAVLTLLVTQTTSSAVPLRAVIEVVGVVAGLAAMGVERAYAALPPGRADIAIHRSRHVLEALLDGSVPLFDPVGAALLAGLAHLGRPSMQLQRAGYGLGQRNLPVLDAARVWIGDMNAPQPRNDDRRPTMSMLQQWMGTTSTETRHDSPAHVVAKHAKADALLLIDDGQNADGPAYAQLAQMLQARLGMPVYICWTDGEGVRPTVAACMARGERRLVVAPLFRTPARRAIAELRGMLAWARNRWPGSTFTITNPVWTPDHLLGVLARHANRALATAQSSAGPTALLLVAGPSSDEEENAEWFRLSRLLWERRRDAEAWVDVCFSHSTQPSIATVLERWARGGAGRAVVLPTSFLPGSALDQIITQVDAARGTLGERVVVAPPVGRAVTATALIAQRVREALQRTDGPATIADHGHTHVYTWDSATPLLPPRYQGGRGASAAPMPAAPLLYDEDGNVAWDEIWTDFCDLALAGGPPHRSHLLEPADPSTITTNPAAYKQVLDELHRGLRMVTGLPVLEGASGWIGVRCADEEMALWMLRAIIVENVSVRREGATLFLPAGPDFRLEHEIKNVITAVAKTHHYWTEHRAAME